MLGMVPSITEVTVFCAVRVVQKPMLATTSSATTLTTTMAHKRELIDTLIYPPEKQFGELRH